MRPVTILLFFVAGLTGCATTVPQAIREPAAGDLSLATVRQNVAAHKDQRIHWGGAIASVENRPTETWIEIVGRELNGHGRPRAAGHSDGRFIARAEGFLDPAVYALGRQLTITGVVESETSRPIGEYPYRYPVVRADLVYLWEPLPEPGREYYYNPFWSRPWDPWYPYPYGHPWRY